MAFTDLNEHLNETFGQDTWNAHLSGFFIQKDYYARKQKEYQSQPAVLRVRRDYFRAWYERNVERERERVVEWREKNREAYLSQKAQYFQSVKNDPTFREKKNERKRKWLEKNKERELEKRRAAYAAKAKDPVYMQKRAAENKKYMDRKRAERLASAQQLSANQP